jgi:hypothetical protein
MQNEMKNEKANNQGFLQAEPAELDDTALLYVAAGMMPQTPRTDCICHKQCATNDC